MTGIAAFATYCLLALLWAFILGLYLRHRRDAGMRDPLVALLLGVLALDAFKSLIESAYFGLLWGAQYQVIDSVFARLGAPLPLTAVKLFNLLVAGVVLARLVRTWIPTRLAEREDQHKRLEDLVGAARESEARFRSAFLTVPDALSVGRLDDGVNVAVNDHYCRLSGWTADEVVGRTSLQLGLWVDPEQRAAFFKTLCNDGFVKDRETRFRRKDGSVFDALVSSRLYTAGDTAYFLTISRDVTESRRSARAQQALYRIAEAASSGTLKELLGTVHQIVAELMPAPNLYIALLDPAAPQLEFVYHVDQRDEDPTGPVPLKHGLTEHVLFSGEPLLVQTPEAFRAIVASGAVDQVGTPSLSWVGVPLRTKDRTVGVLAAQIYAGEERYGQRDLELLQFVSTQVAHAIEKKQADEALVRSEQRFRALIESTSDGVCLLDADGTILYSSPAMAQMVGVAPGTRIKSLVHLLHPDDGPLFKQKLEESLAAPGVPVVGQARVRRTDGTTALFEGTFTNLLAQPAVRGIVLNARDLTERKQMEARLMMADRMVSVGTLAAGVAHEINNPLAYVIANLDYACSELKTRDADLAEVLREALSGAERVRVIVRDLKTFSRGDEQKSGPVDLRSVLDASANMAWNEIRHRAHLVRDYKADLPAVLGNESRLGQVFLNLFINAAQAIREGAPQENEIRVSARVERGRLVVDVSDTGAGIPAEHLPRLFDPFFTTKPVGVGTGLGLFICQNIINGFGGEITVQSEVGRGTTMRVTLPLAPAQEAAVAPAAPPARAPNGRRLLIIDDEPLVCSALRRSLPEHQITVETAAPAALARLQRGEEFDLILCDLMMREMSGMAFFDAVARAAPDARERIVFMTGGAFTPAAQDFLARVKNARLQKPIDLPALRGLIARDQRVPANV